MILRDQVYAQKAGGDLTFDLIRPDSDAELPLVMCIHGGGWISGEKEAFWEEAEWLAAEGFAVACISYRLAPLYPFPAAIADVQDFITFARTQADAWKIRPDQICTLGNSAGGHLALMGGYCRNHLETGEPTTPANAVVDICGIADLRIPEGSDYGIAQSFLEQFMDGPYVGNEEKWERASPMVYASPESPRTLILHGDQDDVVPVELSQNLHAALRDMGVPCEYHELPGEGHSFTWEGWQAIRGHYRKFLGEFA